MRGRDILERMKTGFAISTVMHLAVLIWAVVTFVSKPLNAMTDSISVDMISTTDFSKLAAGLETAKKVEPKPMVDKIGEKKAATSEASKIAEKEVVATREQQQPPPQPEVKKVEPKQSKPEPKSDPIAEALKKEEAKKKEEKKQEQKAAEKPPVPQKPVRAYDPSKVAQLLDKRDPMRLPGTGEVISRTASLGAVGATAPVLSQSEEDALRARLQKNWSPPIGAEKVSIEVVIQLRRDKHFATGPRIMTSGSGPVFDAAREAALRAVLVSAPFDMLRPENYDAWQEVTLFFDEGLLKKRP